uniref:SEA domain-containing protein n=1 Tax=Caenorhabditis tropicalis TaxID=1561998 RepID=A0A1I7UN62_9PELO
MFSKYFTAILLFTMIQSISATGRLRLDITPSNDLALRIITNVLHAESFWMTMGEEITTSFHPLFEQDSIKISFSVDGMTPQVHVYELRKAGTTKRNVFVFDQMVLLVDATFECDDGFTGSRCQRKISKAAVRTATTTTSTSPTASTTDSTTTSTTDSTTTSTTDSTTETTTTAIPSTSTSTAKRTPSVSSVFQLDTNTIIIICLIIVVLVLFIFILILIIRFVTQRRQSIHIESSHTYGSPEAKKTIDSMTSGASKKTNRYTAEPHISIIMTP